jgi:hypothetical protein
LLQALAGAGRQADALGAFRDYRAYLAESVGTEPSAEVRRLDRRVASGWDGVEATAGDDAGSSGGTRRPARWLPLAGELARGPRLIGRGRELTRLVSDLALVSGTGSRTVILEGEAGIGKTTLLGGFARAVRDSGSAAVLYGSCPGGPAVPSEPFPPKLKSCGHGSAGSSPAMARGGLALFYLLSIWSWLGNGVPLCQGSTWPNWTSSP